MVTPQNPFKTSNSLLNEQHRKHLIDLAIEGEKKIRSSSIEFNLPKPSYTIDTLAYLSEKFPEHQFSILMGSDSFSNIKNWKNSEILLKNYEILIYQRPEFPINADMITSKIKIIQAPLLDISSSMIRKMIKARQSIRYVVPEIVKQEIEAQQYFN